jgi:hypothetical protein
MQILFLKKFATLSLVEQKKTKNVPFGISLPPNWVDSIDLARGDVSRSRFILRILEKTYPGSHQNRNNSQRNKQFAETELFTSVQKDIHLTSGGDLT